MSIQAPNCQLFGEEPYLGIPDKVAKLIHELATLHAYIDGNKRTSFQSGVVILMLKGYYIDRPEG